MAEGFELRGCRIQYSGLYYLTESRPMLNLFRQRTVLKMGGFPRSFCEPPAEPNRNTVSHGLSVAYCYTNPYPVDQAQIRNQLNRTPPRSSSSSAGSKTDRALRTYGRASRIPLLKLLMYITGAPNN